MADDTIAEGQARVARNCSASFSINSEEGKISGRLSLSLRHN